MDRRAVVATHHKTGTVWMNQTFRLICRNLDIPFAGIDRMEADQIAACRPPVVLVASHSKFKKCPWLPGDPESRLFHLIRDPRDVIISAMHYHRISREEWLHVPLERLGGATRQEKLNSLSTDRERFLFEMEHGSALSAMRNWDYAKANCFECKYEDLIRDAEAVLFTRAVTHLGFSEGELDVCRAAFLETSLFSRRKKPKATHVRSGAPQQWRGVFDRELGRAFVDRFGDLLVVLGYEKDDAWVDSLPAGGEREILDRKSA